MQTAAVVDSIKQNQIDLGLIVNSECRLNKPELVDEVLYQDKIVVGVSNKLPLAERSSINISELSNLPLIVSLKNTVSRKALINSFTNIPCLSTLPMK